MKSKQQQTIAKLISGHSADQHTKETLLAGSILLTLWKNGETKPVGIFKVTRNGNATNNW